MTELLENHTVSQMSFVSRILLFGITSSKETLLDEHADKEAQAEALSFLIHLVGDIHQPLHCSTLFNSTFKLPDGDRGGNNFMVKMKPTSANSVKLHTSGTALSAPAPTSYDC
jgi:hypothetical protein